DGNDDGINGDYKDLLGHWRHRSSMSSHFALEYTACSAAVAAEQSEISSRPVLALAYSLYLLLESPSSYRLYGFQHQLPADCQKGCRPCLIANLYQNYLGGSRMFLYWA